LFDAEADEQVEPAIARIVDGVIESTARLTDGQLKTRTYLTEPMKRILRAEKTGRSMINTPLLSHPS
jgi:hypothetical protein